MLKSTYINPYGFALSAVCLTVSFPIFADTDINVLNNLEEKMALLRNSMELNV